MNRLFLSRRRPAQWPRNVALPARTPRRRVPGHFFTRQVSRVCRLVAITRNALPETFFAGPANACEPAAARPRMARLHAHGHRAQLPESGRQITPQVALATVPDNAFA